jgi:hypothetical protein
MRTRVLCLAMALGLTACISGAGWAAQGKALGSVVQANNALVDNQAALAGADLYVCDVLDTDSYGTLFAQFGSSQIVLGASSEVVLDGDAGAVHVIVFSGSASFSAQSSEALIIDTPAGSLRGVAGQAFSGTVTISAPKQLTVSALRGDLVLNSAGSLHTVPAGKSAKISFDEPAVAGCRSSGKPVRRANGPHAINFKVVAGVAGGIAAYPIWKELTESETKPD